MNQQLFLALFSVLGFGYTYVGYKASQGIKTIDDYFLAGRKLGLFSLTIALIATQLGGGVILGTSKEAYTQGLYGLMYVMSISIGFMLLAGGLAGRMRQFNVNTTAELFETEFKSSLLKKIASIFSMLSLCGILLAQVVASRNLMLSLQVYSEPLFLLFWLFVIGYTMVGGLRAVVNNDVFQLAFIITVFCTIFAIECIFNFGSLIQTFSLPSLVNTDVFTWSRLFAIIVIPACYSLIEQDIAQTLFAARSPRIALAGSFIASIFMLCFALIPVYFGMKARILELVIPEGANPLMFLFDATYPPVVVTLVVYGVFAAIISTADALLCAISSHFVQDFNLPSFTSHALKLSKACTLFIGLGALIVGRYFTNIIDIIVGSYNIPVLTLFVPLMCCYCMSSLSPKGAWYSIVLGLISYLLFKTILASSIVFPEAIALACSFGGYIIGYYYDYSRNTLLQRTIAN